MARPCKLTPEIQQRIGENLLWDSHILLLPKLQESRIRLYTNG